MVDKKMTTKLKKLNECLTKAESLKNEISEIKLKKLKLVFDKATKFMMTNPDTQLEKLPEVVETILQKPRKSRAKKSAKKITSAPDEKKNFVENPDKNFPPDAPDFPDNFTFDELIEINKMEG